MADVSHGRSIRRALYLLFARLFSGPPDPELFGKIAGGSLETLARAQGLDLLGDLVDARDPVASSAELEAEYARLFRDVSLRASDYDSGASDPVASIAAYLREHALALEASCRLPCDHLSVVLGVMAALAGGVSAPGEGESDRDRARAFLERHLLSWAPDALAEIAAHADRRFYRALAAMLSAFLASERKLYEVAA